MNRCVPYILPPPVDLFRNPSVIDKFSPKFERFIDYIYELSPVAVICNLHLPYRFRRKMSVHEVLLTFGIAEASSYRAGNCINGFIRPLSNLDVFRRRGDLAANSYIAVLFSEFSSESTAPLIIHTKVRVPVCFELLALLRRHVLPNPVSNMPRSYSGIESAKIQFSRILWSLVSNGLKPVQLPFEFFQKFTGGIKSVGRSLACPFHQFFGSFQNMVRGFCVNHPISAIGYRDRTKAQAGLRYPAPPQNGRTL